MATENPDLIHFIGSVQQVTVTLVNPYSSKSYDIDDEFFTSTLSYDGLGGNDTILLTPTGDFVSITDNTGMQVIRNIETFLASDGGDIINLAHSDIVYGDVTLLGGGGDDILWGNAGNDLILGGIGDDIIDGGPGVDDLRGGLGNDQVFGGEGDDIIDGGSGDDILYGGTDLGLRELDKDFIDNVLFPQLIEGTDIENILLATDALGINADNLTVDFDATATLTFRDGFAGYNNTLGVYSIAEDGTIEMASVLWANVKTAGINVDHQIDLPVGADGGQFGFFIIANGDRVNGQYSGLDITGNDVVSFVYDYGGPNERAATVNDDGNLVSFVYNDGTTEQVLGGYHYHTTPRGASPDINWDGDTHAISGLPNLADPDLFRIGFEDLPNLGDADYEDVLFDLNINQVHVDASEQGNDTILGGEGNDVIYGEGGNDIMNGGEGNDVIFMGNGVDTVTGELGDDIFVLNFFDGLVDTVTDFNTLTENDVINITDILEGYDPMSDAISDFVQLVDNGGDTELHINQDGDVGGAFTAVAIFEGGINDTLGDLISNGNLVADQSVVV